MRPSLEWIDRYRSRHTEHGVSGARHSRDPERRRSRSPDSQKHRELATALILSPNRAVSRDALIDILWGEHPPPSARKLLRVYVSQVRRALAVDRLETRPGGYLIRIDDGELDSARFDDLLRRGRTELRQGRLTAAHGLLSSALALWRGSALVDVADEEFARTEAGRLDEARLGCIEDRIEVDLALGRHPRSFRSSRRSSASTRSARGPIAS